MNNKLLVIFSALLFIPHAFCQSTLSLIEFEGIGIPPDLTRSIAKQIESKLSVHCNCAVVSHEELDGTMVDFLKKRTSHPTRSPSPSPSIDHIVTGTLSKIGPTYNIVLKLVSVETGIIIRSISKEHSGSIEALFPFTDAAVADLFKHITKETRTDTLFIPIPTPVTLEPNTRKEVTPEPSQQDQVTSSHDERSQWMIEKIGIGAIAIFATIAAIILTTTTR